MSAEELELLNMFFPLFYNAFEQFPKKLPIHYANNYYMPTMLEIMLIILLKIWFNRAQVKFSLDAALDVYKSRNFCIMTGQTQSDSVSIILFPIKPRDSQQKLYSGIVYLPTSNHIKGT